MGCMVQIFLFPGAGFSYAYPTHCIQNISARNKGTRRMLLLRLKNKLEQMGPVKRNEWMMMGTMLVTVTLWIFGERLDISTLAVAMMGLSVLLILRVLSWDDCLSEKVAWNTLTWFTVFLGMADQLNVLGVIPWLSGRVASFIEFLPAGWYNELFFPPVDVLLHSLSDCRSDNPHRLIIPSLPEDAPNG
ncbi:putative solute carrier family 13 [Helianthus debilis subsp. tardiflorus]